MFAALAGMMLATAALTGSSIAADAIVLNFSSPHCAPCQAMKPTLEQLERSGVPVRHIDVTQENHLVSRYGIRNTPTFVVISGGKEVTRLVGTQSLAQLQAAIAIDPSGPLIPTGAKSSSLEEIPAPQTRLAPIGRLEPAEQALTSTITADLRQPGPPPSQPNSLGEAMPSLSLADAVERARAATVRLRVHDGHGYGAGTGTIIDTHGDEALVLTCGHLFRETQGQGKIEVDLFVGGQTRTVLGEVLDYDADTRDIALVAIRPGFPVQPVQLLGPTERVQNGQTAFSFGCDRGDDPSRRDTRITGIDKYNQHLGVSNLEIAGAPIDGRSGGGLFDAAGRLIGVCNAADYKGDVGIYAGPGNVQWQLDRVGLSALYQSPQSGGQTSLAAIAPPEQLAGPVSSLPPDQLAVRPVSLAAPPSASPSSASPGRQEMIIIVRDLHNPSAGSRVMTLQQPTDELLRLIQQQAR
jgi:thiol-disulfide isomerase/thioredoxin